MSDLIEDAVARITVQDNSGAGVTSATRNFNSLYEVVRNNWWGIQNLGRAFEEVGGALAAGLGAGVRAAMDFEQSMAQVTRTAGLTVDETAAMGQQLRNLALIKPIDIKTLADIAAQAGALGIAKQDIVAFTGAIADLTATTDLTADSATQLARLGGVLGLTGQDYQRLGSAILDAGVNTAASEKQIVTFAVRLTGAAASAHLTAAEVVALSAATYSLGSNAEAGASAITLVLGNMARAVANGGATLQNFATISGVSGQKFADTFKGSATAALILFVEGLGRVQKDTVSFNRSLDSVGITAVRQRQAIGDLAAGTVQHANNYLNLRDAVTLTTKAYQENTELTKQSTELYKTSTNQLTILKNVVHDAAIGFGGPLLSALHVVLTPIADIIWGFQSLPNSMKIALDILALFTSGILLAAGAMTLIIPRITLIMGSVRELFGVFRTATNEARLVTTALNAQAAAAGETGTITAFQASKVSAAKKEEAVAWFQAQLAKQRDEIQTQGNIAATEAYLRMDLLLTEAKNEENIAERASAQAKFATLEALQLLMAGEIEQARMAMAVAESLDAEAVAANEAAAGIRQAALAAEEDAVAARAQAVADMEAATAAQALAVAEEEASATSYALGAALDAATGPFAIFFLAITAVTVALGFLGSSHRDAAKAADEQVQADQRLVDILTKTRNLSDATVQSFFTSNQKFLALAAQLREATSNAVSPEMTLGFVSGTASADQMNHVLEILHQRQQAGDKSAAGLARSLLAEYEATRQAVAQAQVKAEVTKVEGAAADTTADQTDKLTKAKQKQYDVDTAANQAALDMPSALMGVKSAQIALTQAQEAYTQALENSTKKAEDVANAESNLAQAQIQHRRAQQDLATAQQNLADARANAAQKVIDSQNKLADDNDKLADTHQKILDLEKKIADERQGPSLHDITQATNKLADANEKLLDSQKAIGDAQYMVNYLMAEGASARDIADAQDNLTSARNKEADAALAQQDAAKDLATVRAGTDPAALAKDERDLAAAEREVGQIQKDITDDQKALNQARKDQANDTAYKDAQDALLTAQLNLADSNWKIVDAQRALTDARREDPTEAVKEAQQRLAEAYFGLATANVRVKKDTLEMQGVQVDAGMEAHLLADALGDQAAQVSGPISDDWRKYIAVLKEAKEGLTPPDNSNPADTGLLSAPPAPLPVDTPKWAQAGDAAGKAWYNKLFDWINPGKIADAILHALMVALLLVNPIGLIVIFLDIFSGMVTAAVHWLIDNGGPAIGHAFATAWHAITGALDVAWNFVVWLASWIGRQIARGTIAMANFVVGLFTNAWHAFTRGADGIWDFVKWLGGWISRKFTGGAVAIGNFLSALANSAWTAFVNTANRGWDLLRWLGGWIGRLAMGAAGLFGSLMIRLADWAWNQFTSEASGVWNFVQWLMDKGEHWISAAWDWLSGFGNRMGHRIWDGIKDGFGSLTDLITGAGGSLADKAGGFLEGLVGLATGGVVTRPTVANVGESGPEAVIPLDRLFASFQPMYDMADQLIEANSALNAVAGTTYSTNNHGGDVFNIVAANRPPVDIAREVVWQKQIMVR